jgi:hypothetical protein
MEGGKPVLLDEVSEDLRVCLRTKLVTSSDQLGPEHIGVLDDPVVAHRDFARTVVVGVGVHHRGLSVGGPSSMGDTAVTLDRLPVDQPTESFETARGPACVQSNSVLHGQAGRVIPPVLEPAEGLEEDGAGLLGSGVRDDSTHGPCIPFDTGSLRGRDLDFGARWIRRGSPAVATLCYKRRATCRAIFAVTGSNSVT